MSKKPIAALASSSLERLDRLRAQPHLVTGKLESDRTPARVATRDEAPAVARPGDLLDLPLERLRDHPRNPRVFYPLPTSSEDLEFEESIKKLGQLEAVQAYPPDSDGMFTLRSGHRRLRALRKLGIPLAKVLVVEPAEDELQEFKLCRAINAQRSQQTTFDDAVRFRELLEQGVVPNQAALARRLDVTETLVSKLLAIGELPRAVLERMASHPKAFGVANAYAISLYWKATGSEEAVDKLLQRVIDGKLSLRDLESLLKRLKSPPEERERPVSQYKISGALTGKLRMWGGKVELSLETQEAGASARLYEKVLALLRSEASVATEPPSPTP